MKEIICYLRPYRKKAILAVIMVTISTVCNLLLPTLMSDIVNQGIYHADYPYILRCCGKMLAVAVCGLIAILIGTKNSSEAVAGFCADLRRDVFHKVNTLSFEEFARMGTAALITRSTHDIDTVSWVASMLSGTVVTIPALFFGGVILAYCKDALLATVMLCFLPTVFAAVVLIMKKVAPLWEVSDQFIDKQNHILRERLWGIRVIRAFNKESEEHERLADATRKMAENIIKANISMQGISPLAIFVFNAAVIWILYLGGVRMETVGSPTAGDIFAIVQYITLVTNGVMMAAFALVMFPHAKVAAERIGEITHAEGMQNQSSARSVVLQGDVRLEGVSFRYENADRPAVEDISLHITPGQKISIIGGTGSGKSTLVQLLLGFRQPTEGEIFFDHVPSRELGGETVRDNISVVLQKTAIYSGTVRDNLLMGKPDATEEELWQAASAAQIGEFIRSLEQGLDHELVQAGKNLSGGQKQRLSIARAMLKDAPIYLFDDSFSALDFLTEARIREELNHRLRHRTRIIITQRVTSAMDSDCIYVMDRGRIVGQGTHGELLENCGIYGQIYASQTGGGR